MQGVLRIIFMLAFLSGGYLLFASPFVLRDDGNMLNSKTIKKIDEIGKEIHKKTGVRLYILILNGNSNVSLNSGYNAVRKKLSAPYALLMLDAKNEKVDIKNSPSLSNKFDKNSLLSPFSNGAIIPILVEGGEHKEAAAILSGYSQIANQIAKSFNVKLESGLKDEGRFIIDIVKLAIYLSIIVALLVYIYKKVGKRR